MARDPKLIDLTGLTQKELLQILYKEGTYHGDEMIAALEGAPGIRTLDSMEAEYRSESLKSLRIEKAYHLLAAYITDWGGVSFSLDEIVLWGMTKTLEKTHKKYHDADIRAACKEAKPILEAQIELLVEAKRVEKIGQRTYRLVPRFWKSSS